MIVKKETGWRLLMFFGMVLLLVLLFWFMFSGENRVLLESLIHNDFSNEELQDKLKDFGVRGYITISALSMLQVVCTFLPAEPAQMLAGLTFGFPVGLLCCYVGVFLGNTIIYLLQKCYGDKLRFFVSKKMDIDLDTLSRSSKSAIIILILYILPAIPYGLICFFAASIGMRYRRFIIVTMLGSLPSVCIGVGLGHVTLSYNWVVVVILFGVLAIAVLLMTIFRKKLFSKLYDYANKTELVSKTAVRKENGLLLTVLYSALRVYYFFRGLRVRKINKLEGHPEKPAIVLCNHGSFIDFVYAEAMLRKSRPHFVVARLYFYHKWLGTLLRELGCFPKSMFALDIESTKNCLRVLQRGEILAMMPEARLSTAGRFEDIQESTYSFLKKSGVPVYTVKLRGDYFADPKWGNGLRRGARVEAELDILFTAQQLKELSLEQIRRGVEERLYYDEFAWLETQPKLRYRSRRLAEGLENILSVCPVCKKKHTISTRKREIFCSHCGRLTALNDRYGFEPGFVFDNFGQWYAWQKELLKQQILADPEYVLQSAVELRLPGDGKSLTRHAGNGTCTLSRSGLTYEGTKDGQPYRVSFAIDKIYRLLFGAGKNFEIYNGSEILFFVPEIKQSAVDWYLTSIILYDEAAAD